MIKRFKEYLAEGKQVGTIYHFTNPEALMWILVQDELESGSHPFISFTRDWNLKNPYTYGTSLSGKSLGTKKNAPNWSNVRLVIDGDKLSNNNKVEPYSDVIQGFSRKNQGESEERVKSKYIKNISKFIKQIDIIKGTNWETQHLEFESDVEDPLSEYGDERVTNSTEFLDFLKRMIKKNSIKKNYSINLVSSFGRVK